jgi:hypothetical protein
MRINSTREVPPMTKMIPMTTTDGAAIKSALLDPNNKLAFKPRCLPVKLADGTVEDKWFSTVTFGADLWAYNPARPLGFIDGESAKLLAILESGGDLPFADFYAKPPASCARAELC